jgi:threonine dehydrogenase-like Zn-dependent dehydrogenase
MLRRARVIATSASIFPRPIELVRSGGMHPEEFFTQRVAVTSAVEAYHHFDQHETGWLKAKLEPEAAQRAA